LGGRTGKGKNAIEIAKKGRNAIVCGALMQISFKVIDIFQRADVSVQL
jgi:hypothetical protein